MATENLYLVLDLFLDPAVLDFKKLQAEVDRKVTIWNRNPTEYAHQLDVAQKFLARGTAPGMNDGGPLITQATEARLTREEFGKEKAASYEDDGRLEQMEVEAHIKEFERYFREDTIRSWFTLDIDEGGDYVFEPPKEQTYGNAKITPPGTMRKIASDLKIILADDNADLYRLLGLYSGTDSITLAQAAEAAYDKAGRDPMKGRDPKADALIRVLGLAKSIFKDSDSRLGYDIALSHRSFHELIETKFKGRALKGWIMISEYQRSVSEVCEEGLDRKEAEWMVYNYYCNTRSCPYPKRTNDEEVAIAKETARKAKEDAQQKIDQSIAKADALIAAAKKEARAEVAAIRTDADTEIKSARERADRKVADAEANANDARTKRFEAESKQKHAEEAAANAIAIARKEFEDEKSAAIASRLKAEEEHATAQKLKNKAQDEIAHARDSVVDAMQKQKDAEKTAQIEIANANTAQQKQKTAEKNRKIAFISSSVLAVIAIAITLYCLQLAHSSAKYATAAHRRADDAEKEVKERAAASIAKAEEREKEAAAVILATSEARQKALDEQRAANDARAAALEEQKVANEASLRVLNERQAVDNLRASTEREKIKAIEEQRIAQQAKVDYDVAKNAADVAKKEADVTKQEADVAKAQTEATIQRSIEEAKIAQSIAETKAAAESERRKGVEALIEAGAPLKFPPRNNDNGRVRPDTTDATKQPPTSSTNTLPKYGNAWTAEERIRAAFDKVVWRWCLEGELELIGEITDQTTKGYKESQMGSPVPERKNEKLYALNSVMLTNEAPYTEKLNCRYMLSQIEVTQELWESVMGSNPSRFKGANRPVENVSWEDCIAFLSKLNEMKEVLGVPCGYEFSLPTETEWEHACRAGTSTPFHFGSDLNGNQANCDGNYPYGTFDKGLYLAGTSEVGKYPANPWGLQDMHGNVWEWCLDGSDYPLAQKLTDTGDRFFSLQKTVGLGNYLAAEYYFHVLRLGKSMCVHRYRGLSVEENFRIRRGGSWFVFAQYCRSAYRSCGNPREKHDDAGLRLCLAEIK